MWYTQSTTALRLHVFWKSFGYKVQKELEACSIVQKAFKQYQDNLYTWYRTLLTWIFRCQRAQSAMWWMTFGTTHTRTMAEQNSYWISGNILKNLMLWFFFFFFRQKIISTGIEKCTGKMTRDYRQILLISPHPISHLPQFSCFCNGFIGGKV